jgi:hypothetical protein
MFVYGSRGGSDKPFRAALTTIAIQEARADNGQNDMGSQRW